MVQNNFRGYSLKFFSKVIKTFFTDQHVFVFFPKKDKKLIITATDFYISTFPKIFTIFASCK